MMAGTLLIWTIKYGLRPNIVFPELITFFLGIAPNFLGSFLLPFAACWFFGGKKRYLSRFFRIRNQAELKQFCLLGFLLLLINEYLQLIPVFGRTFDYFDILFSMAGLGLGYLVFSRKLQLDYTVSV
jgi:VanZ like family